MSTSYDKQFLAIPIFHHSSSFLYHCQCKEQGGLRLRLACQWLQNLLVPSVSTTWQIVTSCESLLKCAELTGLFPLFQEEFILSSSKNREVAVCGWLGRCLGLVVMFFHLCTLSSSNRICWVEQTLVLAELIALCNTFVLCASQLLHSCFIAASYLLHSCFIPAS